MISEKTNEIILIAALNVLVILVLLSPGLLSLVLPVMLFCTIVSIIQKKRIYSGLMQNRFWKLSLLLPLIYIAGSWNTNYPNNALFEIIQKLSIPLIGFMMIQVVSDSNHFFQNMRKYYLIAISLCVFISLLASCILYLETKSTDAFLYKNFSGPSHPTYYTMFLCMAFVISLENILKPEYLNKYLFIRILLLIIPVVGILLLSSKSGLITLIALMFYFGLRITFGRVNASKYALKIKISFWILLVFITVFILKSDRFYVAALGLKQIHEMPFEELGTAGQRLLIWESVLEVSEEHSLFGTGVGNDQEILNNNYRQKNLIPFYEKSLNAHNQFLQAFLVFGVLGLLFFVVYLLYPLIMGLRLNDSYLTGFGIIILMNALTESILNRQSGVLFWTLWGFILLIGRQIPEITRNYFSVKSKSL
jgi:O-antigen ligase